MELRRFFTQQLNFRYVNEAVALDQFESLLTRPSDARILFEGKGVRVLRMTLRPLTGETEKPCIRVLRKHYPDCIYLFADHPNDTAMTNYHLCNDAGKQLPLTPEKQRLFKERSKIFEVTADVTGTIDLLERIDKAFESEKVTKKFYTEFQKYRELLLKAMQGIETEEDRNWYASVLLNRLMFIYFIQKHGFIGGRQDWLREHLAATEKNKTSFYSDFLLPLFFNAFAQPKGARGKHEKVLADVPYLNGGLFQRHEIEDRCPEISIDNTVFRKLLDYFETYHWYLDERPLHNDGDINPDVLGYIFEKYINQKQMGAYYTQEDITGYNCKYTIVPFLLDKQARILGKDIGKGTPLPLPITAENIERYVYEAVKTTAYLPTETEREYVARTKRYAQICSDAADGKIERVNDLITYNLDILTYADDAIAQMTERELFVFYFECLQKVTVLDPTCGSGAFLFAALNILLPLYQACINRIRAFAQAKPRAGTATEQGQFKAELKRIAQHDNERYYTVKSIIVNNLYGVDIMEEATEICKLRLFLRLAAEIKDAANIEPLPDIDFNIKAGNTLVGFATRDQVKEALSTSLHGDAVQGRFLSGGDTLADDAIAEVERKCREVDRQYRGYHRMQISDGYQSSDLAEAKVALKAELHALNDELNRALAREYGIALPVVKAEARTAAGRKGKAPVNTLAESAAYQKWLHSHQPFHWFAEFYGILAGGGFDVIVGNPPYVEYSKVRDDYTIQGYKTIGSGNLYAFITERSISLLRHHRGCLGLIIPISFVCTQRMESLQVALQNTSRSLWLSNYAERPSRLFTGAEVLLTIVIACIEYADKCEIFTTGFTKWSVNERDSLFELIGYLPITHKTRSYIYPKISSCIESSILNKLNNPKTLGDSFSQKHNKNVGYYRIGGGRYWKIFTNYQPRFVLNGKPSISSRENYLYFNNSVTRDAAISILSSSLFYWYFILTTNCRDLNPIDLRNFPVCPDILSKTTLESLSWQCECLMKDYREKSRMKDKVSSLTGDIQYQEFYPRLSKPIIDEIDRVLAQHYGFTDEELDFIINYDIKYRMGKDAGVEEEE